MKSEPRTARSAGQRLTYSATTVPSFVRIYCCCYKRDGAILASFDQSNVVITSSVNEVPSVFREREKKKERQWSGTYIAFKGPVFYRLRKRITKLTLYIYIYIVLSLISGRRLQLLDDKSVNRIRFCL